MKFVGVFILVCLAVCCVNSATVTTWGNTNLREMGRHREFALPNTNQFYHGNQFQIRNFTYPRVRNFRSINTELSLTFLSFLSQNMNYYQPRQRIAGIKHIDHSSRPVKVDFKNSTVIGSYNVTIQLTSQRGHGINSTFIFY